MSSVLVKVRKGIRFISEAVSDLGKSYKICFVWGHQYLNDSQITQLNTILHSRQDNREIVEHYEKQMADRIGSGFGISFASGRMAFYALLTALGIGKGDEVILTGYTCSVMVNAVWRVGAVPVFADINPETLGMDALDVGKKITPRTKAIVPQHSFGIPCNIDQVVAIAQKHNIPVIEDCALSFDSAIHGIKVGNWGDAAIFSTDHSKPINTLIGGFLYTRNENLYKKLNAYAEGLPQLGFSHQQRIFDRIVREKELYRPQCYPRRLLKEKISCLLNRKKNVTIFLDQDYKRQVTQNLSYPYPAKLPPLLAQLGLYELARWDDERQARKKMLEDYKAIACQYNLAQFLPKAYFNSQMDIVPLRFVFCYPNAEKLVKKMQPFLDINWIWFKSPIVCCPDGVESMGYAWGACQAAEEACSTIINWPIVLDEQWRLKILDLFKRVAKDNL